MKRILSVSAAALLAIGLAGCGDNVSNEDIGLVGGAVAGGLLGSTVGGGSGKVAATIGGAAIGGLVGREVGRSTE